MSMSLRQGVVVDTHPEDNSVDLVMLDDGSRLVGVQLSAPSASTRSGRVDLPQVPAKTDKWDITQKTGQDQIAIVGFVNKNPVVLGFLLPQINQMTFADKAFAFYRHQSDVYSWINAKGEAQLVHPNGSYLRFGKHLDFVDISGTNFDKNLKFDRNTQEKLGFHAVIPGAIDIQLTADGSLSIKVANLSLETNVNITGDLAVGGNITIGGNLSVDGTLNLAGRPIGGTGWGECNCRCTCEGCAGNNNTDGGGA